MTIEYGTSEHGHEFPVYEGALLSWDLSSTATLADAREGYPRTRLLVRAMLERRPAQLRETVQRLRIDSMGRMFGVNAARLLAVVEAELAELGSDEGLDAEGLDADATMLPFCACGRRPAECDGSRRGCRAMSLGGPADEDDDGWGDYCSPVEGDV